MGIFKFYLRYYRGRKKLSVFGFRGWGLLIKLAEDRLTGEEKFYFACRHARESQGEVKTQRRS